MRGVVRKLAMFMAVSLVAGTMFAAPKQTSCISCHSSDKVKAEYRKSAGGFHADVHSRVGLSCHDCHGGNPDLALRNDAAAAKNRNFPTNRYVGVPKRQEIPDFCGRCHSSLAYMRRFNPSARVDEVGEYWTSVHGQKLKSGNTEVATCIDCHSVHDIQRKGSPESPVHATHVAQTCSECHSNAKVMKASGSSIPVNQYGNWRMSVHAKALFDKGDVTAPTCNDCHGNHGATPPGVESIAFVCGNCHTRESELFRGSPKFAKWEEHNELMEGMDGCGDCHDDMRSTVPVMKLAGCVTCHDNHFVVSPSVAMLGPLPDTACAFCHEGQGPLAKAIDEPQKTVASYSETRAKLVAEANRLKLSDEARFDWFVDRARSLAQHRVDRSDKRDGAAKLRPEFARLFAKFRIGKTHHQFKDPATGKVATARVRRCTDCHPSDGLGALTASTFLRDTRWVTGTVARAQRMYLHAKRGGVEVRTVGEEIDQAVDAQVELETLVHSFSPTGEFQVKRNEGLLHSRNALEAATIALDELQYRRRGLGFALGVILLTLLALGLKIRSL